MYVFPWVNVSLSCFKQLSSNFTLFCYQETGSRILSHVAGGLTIPSDKPLDFDNKIRSLLLLSIKYLYIDWKNK